MTRRPGWILDWRPAEPGARNRVIGCERAYGVTHYVAQVGFGGTPGAMSAWAWGITPGHAVAGVTQGSAATAEEARLRAEAAWVAWKARREAEGQVPYFESNAHGRLNRETGQWEPPHPSGRAYWLTYQNSEG